MIEAVLATLKRVAKEPLRSKAKLLDADNALLAIAGLEHPRRLLHRLNGYEITVGLTDTLVLDLRALRTVAPLGLGVAPELVERIELSDAETVLVTRYRACATGRLVPAEDAALSPAAVDRALGDLKKLHAAGFNHVWAKKGLGCWLVASDTGTLLLGQWGEALQELNPADSDSALAKIEQTLRSYQTVGA
jgi:hypothetical protein